MSPLRICVGYCFLATSLVLLHAPRATAQPALPEGGGQAAGDAQVLERGPVHEAFAEPFAVDPGDEQAEALIVPKQPPELIDEIPPEVRPEGNNVQWIPGYWMWSVDLEDFIWISGIWRNFPPGREWVSGYWEEVRNGFRWMPGFWQEAGGAQPIFLPEPPGNLDLGPNQPAPTVNHFWIPGCWTWQTTQYVWRPGYWYPGQNNWVWTPHRYAWTPRGYLFVRGYWDFPLARRGLLYAPVYWARPLVAWRHLSYTPRYVVSVDLLLGNLFVHPIHRHYYYGHYDRAFRARHGLTPWFDVHPHRHGRGVRSYDPLLAYHNWQHHGRNPHWLDDMRSDFARRHDHPRGDGRPGGPRGNQTVETTRRSPSGMVRSVTEYVRDPDTTVKVTRLSNPQILEARQAARQRVAEKHLEGRQVVRGPNPTRSDGAAGAAGRGSRGEATTRAKVTIPGDRETTRAETPRVDPRTNNREQVDPRVQARQRALRDQAGADAAEAARQRRGSTERPSYANDPRYQQYRQRLQQATEQAERNPTQRFQGTPRNDDSRTRQDATTFYRFRGQSGNTQPTPTMRNDASRRPSRLQATPQPTPTDRRTMVRPSTRSEQIVPSQGRGNSNTGRGAPAARSQFRGNASQGSGRSKSRRNR